MQLYLQRRAGQQQSERRDIVGVQYLCQFTVMILHAMALINDHVLPAHLQQRNRCTKMEVRIIVINTVRGTGLAKYNTEYEYNPATDQWEKTVWTLSPEP